MHRLDRSYRPSGTIAIDSYSEIVRWLGNSDPTTRRVLEHILEDAGDGRIDKVIEDSEQPGEMEVIEDFQSHNLDDEAFESRVAEFMEKVSEHIRHEHEEVFPLASELLGRERLNRPPPTPCLRAYPADTEEQEGRPLLV